MASLSYASTGANSPSAGGIGWINWGTGFTITPGQTYTGLTATLRDGSTATFNLTNTTVSGPGQTFSAVTPPTWSGAAFGGTGYTGIGGAVVLYGAGPGVPVTNNIVLSGISLKDPNGNTISNYSVIIADAESTNNGEQWLFTTNGSVWSQLINLPSVNSPASGPSITGVGSLTVTETGFLGNCTGPVFLSTNPTQVTAQCITPNSQQAVAFGFAINTVSLHKVLGNRISAADQFQLSITGAQSSSTITSGALYGAQTQSARIYGLGGTYAVNESMAGGSVNPLGLYSTSIAYSNLSPGGTTVPSSIAVPGSVTLALGDVVVATIYNSVPFSATTSKQATGYSDVNGTILCTIPIANTGVNTITSVTLVDTIPAGTSYVAGSLAVNGTILAGSPSSVNIGTVPASGVVTVTYQLKVAPTLPTGGVVHNSASIQYSVPVLPSPLGGTMNTGITSTTISTATLAATKSVSSAFADVGTTLTYTITLPNSGNTTANNVVLIDTIPAGTTFVAGSVRQDGAVVSGSPALPGITLPSPVGPGAISTVTFQVVVATIPSPNPVPNIATVGYTYTVNPSTPNGASSGLATNTVLTTVSHGALSNVTKQAVAAAAVGDTLTYTIAMQNTGNTTVTGVTLLDTVPVGTSFVAGSLHQDGTAVAGSPNPPGITLPNSIPTGSISTVTFRVVVNSLPSSVGLPVVNTATAQYAYFDGSTLAYSSASSNNTTTTISGSAIINTAALTYSYGVGPTITATGSAGSSSAITNINSPIISAVKSVSAVTVGVGQQLSYTILLSNSGNTTASSYQLVDTIPAGTSFVAGSLQVGGVTLAGSPAPPSGITLPDLGAGQSTTVTFGVTAVSIPSTNPTPNSAVSSYQFIVDPSLGTVRTAATLTNTVYTNILGVPVITPAKSVDQSGVFVGDTLHYTVVFANTGSATAANLFFSDTTPAGTTFVPNSVQIGGVPQIGVTLNPPGGITLPSIAPGQTVTLTYQVQATSIPASNPTSNQGTASYSAYPGNSIVNSNAVTTFIHHNPAPVKTANTASANLGDTVTYTLTWTELDGMAAQNVTFVDTIPSQMTFVANSVSVNGVPQPGATILPPTGINVGSVAAHQTVTVTFQGKVTSL